MVVADPTASAAPSGPMAGTLAAPAAPAKRTVAEIQAELTAAQAAEDQAKAQAKADRKKAEGPDTRLARLELVVGRVIEKLHFSNDEHRVALLKVLAGEDEEVEEAIGATAADVTGGKV